MQALEDKLLLTQEKTKLQAELTEKSKVLGEVLKYVQALEESLTSAQQQGFIVNIGGQSTAPTNRLSQPYSFSQYDNPVQQTPTPPISVANTHVPSMEEMSGYFSSTNNNQGNQSMADPFGMMNGGVDYSHMNTGASFTGMENTDYSGNSASVNNTTLVNNTTMNGDMNFADQLRTSTILPEYQTESRAVVELAAYTLQNTCKFLCLVLFDACKFCN